MRIFRIDTISRLLAVLLAVAMAACQAADHTDVNGRPNVIVVLIDDQGYGDISLHGNPVLETPNIDSLGRESLRLTDFHVDPTCSPTRAALLTGKYSRRVGVWHTIAGGNYLHKNETTMADVFKASGYRTALFGKWHLGATYPYRPIDRGFDEWLGQGDGGTGTTDDYFSNDRVNDHYLHNGTWVQRDGWATDVFFDAAIDFLQDDTDDRPFFIYLATYIPHDPVTIANPQLIEEMRERLEGFAPQRDIVAPFLASIELMDKKLGDLLEALEAAGREENTIVIFMTDNGTAYGQHVFNAGMRDRKSGVYDGGHRVPFFIRWPAGELPHGTEVKELTAHIDLLPTLIELLDLDGPDSVDFDGVSLAELLRDPASGLSERVLFAERQRVPNHEKWSNAAAMYGKWRFVNNSELHDIEAYPGQDRNLIERHPDIVEKLRRAFDEYWEDMTSRTLDAPYAVIGSPDAEEVFLHPADWQIKPSDVPWNHAKVAAGPAVNAPWKVFFERPGTYRFELRRWPREANVAFAGVPTWDDPVDAWDERGGVEKLLYPGDAVALPVKQVALDIGKFSETQAVSDSQAYAHFDVSLPQGFQEVSTSMLDADGKEISAAYYVYVRRLGEVSR